MLQRLQKRFKAWKDLPSKMLPGLQAIAFISLAVTVSIGLVKEMGWLQPLELRAYDRMVRLRPDAGSDPRLLVVAITEEDIRALKRSTPSDQVLAQAIGILKDYQPVAIGLDLYRDVPQEPGNAELLQLLQTTPNLIAITKLGNSPNERVPPPEGMPQGQVGFNDLAIDPDGVIRRALLFGSTTTETYFSFALRLSLMYLAQRGITPAPSAQNSDNMQLGHAVFLPLEATSGGYQTNDPNGYQILLNYRSPRQVARQVSLSQVLNRQIDREWVQDKIVLIGTTAISGKDLFYTPYSAGEQTDHQMPGVEVHAQMVSQIMSAALNERSLFWFWAEWQEWLWVGVWAIVGGTLAWTVRNPIALGLSAATTMLLLSGSCLIVFNQQGWIPVIAPSIATLMTLSTVVTYRAQQAHRQHQMVMTLLGQNTSPEIAAALWNYRDRLLDSGKLPGQRLVATMLFTDIKDFSTISEQVTPEALLDWLNEYLEAMTDAIRSHHGIINKFTGDGLLAAFGVPIPSTTPEEIAEDAQRAVACALAMGDRLQQLNQIWQQRGRSMLQMRVGIFTGAIVVGSLGSKNRLEYGVIGDSVNTASRLESCAKERQSDVCRILIAHETLVYLQDQFRVEPWGPMALKGKQQMIDVYRVLGRKEASQVEALTTEVQPLLAKDFAIEAETKPDSVNLLP